MTLVPHRQLIPARRTLFDLLACDPFADSPERERASERWSPSVDIKEEEDRYIVTADVPGIDPKDVEITMEKGALTIRGERRSEHEEHEKGLHRMERSYGSFVRSFSFPDSVDVDAIAASGKHGVVTVSIPKKPSEQAKRIAVS
jgi:HSP20 family protein